MKRATTKRLKTTKLKTLKKRPLQPSKRKDDDDDLGSTNWDRPFEWDMWREAPLGRALPDITSLINAYY